MTVSRGGVRQGATRGEVSEAQLLVGAQVVQTQGACRTGACVSPTRTGPTVIAVAPNAVTKRRRDKSFRLRKRVTAKATTATGAGS